ncbi:DUF2026 domain-containing protein [Arthrobacter sp. TPD3018]|jgi:hypothetical protein|uniref:DUF2026 domain-containing protein n=4 Tax=Sphingomonas TaxID=13687 RepID=A0A0D1JY00_9SPHN|nr:MULTISPECIES: DUF2026 family protein [Bacteria]MCP4593281.1 DUF2026 domain-containing protein [bacterium]KIU26078.1 hypothetical protein SR41_16440 [Sphingomonas melonis]MBB3877140.1 hypothetical protein [Sphingomonas aquatilis]MBB4049206.1 hypothetical protein [Sphingomonas zeae]MBB4610499.1 hypothetical protein [Sphingomonas yabuuchiae]
MSTFLLPLSEFNRIHQVIHGTIKDEGNPGKACTLFACIGALILNKHYKIPARAVAGGFALCVEPEKVMFFGRDGGGTVEFDEDGFHMWVQTETHVIDFMSPLYQEAFQDVQQEVAIPRRMLQKRLSDEAPDLNQLKKAGDYFTMPDPELSERLIDHVLDRPINTDIIHIAETWFGTRRGKQKPSLTIGSNDGLVRDLRLPATVARGAW